MRRSSVALVLVLAAALIACGGSSPAAPADATPSPGSGATGAWQKIYDHPADSATAIEMYDDEFGLALIGHGIERTTDGGKTWHETDSADDFIGPIAIADRVHAWVVGAGSVMLRTTDGGVTWTRQQTDTQAPLASISAVSADEAWVAGYAEAIQGFPPHGASALLHTTDGGTTWQSVDVPGYGIFIGVWFVGDDGWLLATQCHAGDPLDEPDAEPGAPGHAPCRDHTTMLHTPDDGGSWEALTGQAGLDAYYHQIARVDALHAYAVGAQGLYFTSDGGHAWDPQPPFPPNTGFLGMRFRSVDDGWISVTQCGLAPNCNFVSRLAHTRDGGETWELVEFPGELSGGAFDLAADRVVASTPGSTISLYDPARGAWTAASSDGRRELTQITFTTRDHGYASTQGGGLWMTDDGGERWRVADGGIPAIPSTTPDLGSWKGVTAAPWSPTEILPIDDQRAYAVGTTSLSLDIPPDVISTSDGGATWHKEFSLEGYAQTHLVAREGRIWLYLSTSRVNGVDGGYDPPRRTIIYRREIEPAAPSASP